MFELGRTVRFCLNTSPDPVGADVAAGRNTFSADPPMRGLGRYYELHVVCRGEADAQTGYLMNIKRIDAAVRRHALPVLRAAIDDRAPAAEARLGDVLRAMLDALQPALDR